MAQYQLLRPLTFGAEQHKDLLALSEHGIKNLVGVYLNNWIPERTGQLRCTWELGKELPVHGDNKSSVQGHCYATTIVGRQKTIAPAPAATPPSTTKGNRPRPGRKQKAKGSPQGPLPAGQPALVYQASLLRAGHVLFAVEVGRVDGSPPPSPVQVRDALRAGWRSFQEQVQPTTPKKRDEVHSLSPRAPSLLEEHFCCAFAVSPLSASVMSYLLLP